MSLVRLKVAAAAALLSAAGLVSGVARAAGDTTLDDISRYREWARLNDAPLVVPSDRASLGG
jgi:hypothetical protein